MDSANKRPSEGDRLEVAGPPARARRLFLIPNPSCVGRWYYVLGNGCKQSFRCETTKSLSHDHGSGHVAFSHDADHRVDGLHHLVLVTREEAFLDVLRAEARRSCRRVRGKRKEGVLDQGGRGRLGPLGGVSLWSRLLSGLWMAAKRSKPWKVGPPSSPSFGNRSRHREGGGGSVEANDNFRRQFTPSCNFSKCRLTQDVVCAFSLVQDYNTPHT